MEPLYAMVQHPSHSLLIVEWSKTCILSQTPYGIFFLYYQSMPLKSLKLQQTPNLDKSADKAEHTAVLGSFCHSLRYFRPHHQSKEKTGDWTGCGWTIVNLHHRLWIRGNPWTWISGLHNLWQPVTEGWAQKTHQKGYNKAL